MAHFFDVNLSSFDFNKDYSVQQNTCAYCLTQNSPFIKLKSCNHASFFQETLKLRDSSSLICSSCHTTLRHIEDFKQQVEESQMILLNQELPPFDRNKLKRSKIEVYSTIDSQVLQIEIKVETHTDYPVDVKIEREDSDFENDIPLVELKRKKLKNSQKVLPLNKYEGKIKTVILTDEELLEEREREAGKEAYVKLPYKCETCITGFDFELTLKDHMEKRHTKRDGCFECEICKSVLGTEASFKEHTKRHTRRYECEVCGKRMNTLYSIIKHYDERHDKISDMVFSCKDCDFVTESNRKYRYHRDKHRGKPQCALCGNSFANNAGLKMHMFTVHKQSKRVYCCSACNKTYNNRSGLLAHTTSAHTASDAYCAHCKAHFRTASNLRHHLRTHSNHVQDDDRRFKCDECGSKFLTKRLLKEHIDWVHLKIVQHACGRCAKVFKNSAALKKHESFVHEMKRPPRNKMCDHCGRGFTTLSILRSHIRTHTGERPLRCTRCTATFAHPAARYTHAKTHAHT